MNAEDGLCVFEFTFILSFPQNMRSGGKSGVGDCRFQLERDTEGSVEVLVLLVMQCRFMAKRW